jgi:hypothetical protein
MAMLPAPVRLKGGKYEQRTAITFGGDMPQRPGDFGIEMVNGMAWLVRAHEADETQKRKKDEAVELHVQRLMPADALRIRGRHNAVNALAALALATAAGANSAPCCTACASTAASRTGSSRSASSTTSSTSTTARAPTWAPPSRRCRAWAPSASWWSSSAATARARTSRRWPRRSRASLAPPC